MPEVAEKLARVRAYLKKHDLHGVVLNSRANFAWLSGGGDNHIVSQSERGFGALMVTARSAYVVANRIEIDRLTTEEPLKDFTPKTWSWIEPLSDEVQRLCGGKAETKHFASDDPEATGLKALPGDFNAEVRAQLTESEIRRYKSLGRDCALIIETVARHLNAGDSEHQAEADLARHLLSRGIQPFVLLVASDERVKRYRHPTPTAKHMQKLAMLVVCGQRHGLICSLTRLVSFGPLGSDLAARHESACRVEAAYWAATKPGATWGDAFKAGAEQYKKEGFAKEWELHHQGGPTGYSGRDFLATPDEKRLVQDHQAVAWNPSITGTKTEDTYVIDGANRIVVTEASPEWPTVTATAGGLTLKRPAILVR
jgi:Xaa-Pro aminopeptidase